MKVALLNCADLPETDIDEAPLLGALRAEGVDAETLSWDKPHARADAYDAVVLRATWNYAQHLEAFLGYVDAAATRTLVLNPASVVRANVHKRYLFDLEARGVPVPPTRLVERGVEPTLEHVSDWSDVVVKPAVSGGSWKTRRFADDAAGALAFLSAEVAERDMLVQQTLPGFADPGERALVFIEGRFEHAMRKSPRFSGQDECTTPLPSVPDADLEIAHAALATFDETLLYARVDLVEHEGATLVSELECIEPSLFLGTNPPAGARLARAIVERIKTDRSASPIR